MTKVVYRPAADEDFFQIVSYIAEDNPDRATSFVHELRQTCEALARMPFSGKPVDAIYPGLRRFVHRTYLIPLSG